MKKYRVAQVGVGGRGGVHIGGWLASPDRFDLVALCDLDAERLKTRSEQFGVSRTYTDADKMLAEVKPDIFCFSTPPSVRLQLVELAAKHKVKGLVFEKPMARSLEEALKITQLCRDNNIKGAVSHQQKYLSSLQRVKDFADAGELGEVTFIHSTTQWGFSQIGTHFTDYALWANNGSRAKWVVGNCHGKELLDPNHDPNHPAPDYVMANFECENGVRILVESGKTAPCHMPDTDATYLDSRLTVYGTHGYAWGDTDTGWAAFTKSSKGEMLSGKPSSWIQEEGTVIQIPFARDLADWLDDDSKVHPCNIEISYHGYEILTGACLSCLDRTRIDLPIADPSAVGDLFERLRRELPDVPPPKDHPGHPTA